jgi:hypothetical protein
MEMKKNQAGKSGGQHVRSLWVEMKNRGFKIARITGLKSY